MEKKILIEGVDYYIQNGKWIFTKEFHLKRGKCCGCYCKHCPYEHINVPDYKKKKPEQ